MRICFGMAARNEQEIIPTTLRSLFAQSVFSSDIDVEFICVANNCTDRTAQVAQETIDAFLEKTENPSRLRLEVFETETPGKNNVINHTVHNFGHPETDYFFFIDADISFITTDVIQSMIDALEAKPDAFIASDRPVKHVAFKKRQNLFDRISMRTSYINQNAPGQIFGQLYIARGDFMRHFLLPHEIIQDDGFVKKMAVTNFLTEPDDPERRVASAHAAYHLFEAYTRPYDIYATQRRQISGYMIHEWHWTFLKSQIQKGEDAGDVIMRLTKENPHWSTELVDRKVKESDTKRHYRIVIRTRISRWKHSTTTKKLTQLPLLLFQLALDSVVYQDARRVIQKNRSSIWRDTSSSAESLAS
ncbi:glycosyltransferase family 2 protein [Tichowtungia aerotolerans]|uniref:Glycosyltransferase n=1 Tax=Tichowtungia aerotolerans TaxID=2697043 RepID=A0A6P1M8T7_9BACT|nr:glycosyltransferase family A protein [Tichowtungia aerotolerans]QHI70307.1 glycosyltransferase [Tichowtungia aerotolerans]